MYELNAWLTETQITALPQTLGFKAEAVDEVRTWSACTVKEVGNDYVMVSFDSWNVEWNRHTFDPYEIRN